MEIKEQIAQDIKENNETISVNFSISFNNC